MEATHPTIGQEREVGTVGGSPALLAAVDGAGPRVVRQRLALDPTHKLQPLLHLPVLVLGGFPVVPDRPEPAERAELNAFASAQDAAAGAGRRQRAVLLGSLLPPKMP